MQLHDEKVALSLFLSFLLQVSWCIQVGWSYQKSHRNHGTFTSIWLILMVNVGKYTYLYGGSWADQWKQQNSNGNGMVGKYTSPMDPMEIWVVVLNILYFHPETWRRWTHFDKKKSNGLVQPPTRNWIHICYFCISTSNSYRFPMIPRQLVCPKRPMLWALWSSCSSES